MESNQARSSADWRAMIACIAASQHGVVAPMNLADLAPSQAALYHELRGPSWRKVHRNAWAAVGSVDTAEQRAMAALLSSGPGSALSHGSAAALWGLPGYELEPIDLIRVRGSNSTDPSHVTVHRVRRLPSNQVTTINALSVLKPDVLLIWMAAQLHRSQTEVLMDRMWSRRLISGRSLDRTIRQMSARGRKGMGVVRSLFAERGINWVPPASGLESRVMDTLERRGLGGFRRQVDLGTGEEWVGRVDFVHEIHPIVLEVQSDLHHTALSSQRQDAERRARIEAGGRRVVEIWEHDVWYRPDAWVGQVRAALDGARSRSGTG